MSTLHLIRGTIPIKPHLLRFIQWRENLGPDDPIVIPGPSAIATVLDIALTNKKTFLASASRPSIDDYSAKLPVEIKGRRWSSNFIFFTDHIVLRFNTVIAHMMDEEILRRVLEGKRKGHQEKTVILAFMQETGMDEWLDFDAAKKAQYRLRRYKGIDPLQRGKIIYSPILQRYARMPAEKKPCAQYLLFPVE